MPTPAAVSPKPVENDLSTLTMPCPATMPTLSAPKISPRNGCNFTTVISTTMTAIPTPKASTS